MHRRSRLKQLRVVVTEPVDGPLQLVGGGVCDDDRRGRQLTVRKSTNSRLVGGFVWAARSYLARHLIGSVCARRTIGRSGRARGCDDRERDLLHSGRWVISF